MKLRSRMLIGAIVCVVAPALAFSGCAALKRRELQATRQKLLAQGFKTEMSQFEIAYSPEAIARGEAILKADFGIASTLESNICAPVYHAAAGLRMDTSNSVIVPWKEEFYAGPKKRSPWPAVHQTLEKHRLALEGATAALLDGPIGCDMSYQKMDTNGRGMKGAATALSASVLCNLYFDQRADAWTNLLALTRMTTRWEKSPELVFGRLRCELAGIAYTAAWYALQAHCWSHDQLAALECEWKSADFLTRLPDKVGFERASFTSHFESLRRPSTDGEQITLDDLLKNPKEIRSEIKERVLFTYYRWSGSYEDEKEILLFFRDREMDMRRAIQATNVASMLPMPCVTNNQIRMSPYNAWFSPTVDSGVCALHNGGYLGPLGLAAEAEIRRRIILTAIALEHHRVRTGTYPEKLDQLADSKNDAFIDFADGQSLRYRRTSDNEFLLYSIGLDITDNHGDAIGPNPRIIRIIPRIGYFPGTDIIWPLPGHFAKTKIEE